MVLRRVRTSGRIVPRWRRVCVSRGPSSPPKWSKAIFWQNSDLYRGVGRVGTHQGNHQRAKYFTQWGDGTFFFPMGASSSIQSSCSSLLAVRRAGTTKHQAVVRAGGLSPRAEATETLPQTGSPPDRPSGDGSHGAGKHPRLGGRHRPYPDAPPGARAESLPPGRIS